MLQMIYHRDQVPQWSEVCNSRDRTVRAKESAPACTIRTIFARRAATSVCVLGGRAYEATVMLRVLVAINPTMYREVLAHAVRKHHPHAQVRMTAPADLDGEAKRLAPHLIVCHSATGVVREVAKSWVKLEVRLDPEGLDANVKVDSRPT